MGRYVKHTKVIVDPSKQTDSLIEAVDDLDRRGFNIVSVVRRSEFIFHIMYSARKRHDKYAESPFQNQLEEIYKLYPRKAGKLRGMQKLSLVINSEKDLKDFEQSVKNFAQAMKKEQRQEKHIPYFSTFVSQYWTEFVDGKFEPGRDKYSFLDD